MPRLRDPELVAAWRARLARFEHSQLTVAEFCEVENISVASFYQWRRKLEASQCTKPESAGEFIAVRLSGVPQAALLSLPGGATIELPECIGPARLRQLIAAVVDVTSRLCDGAEEV